jgi:hypothetical protein
MELGMTFTSAMPILSWCLAQISRDSRWGYFLAEWGLNPGRDL